MFSGLTHFIFILSYDLPFTFYILRSSVPAPLSMGRVVTQRLYSLRKMDCPQFTRKRLFSVTLAINYVEINNSRSLLKSIDRSFFHASGTILQKILKLLTSVHNSMKTIFLTIFCLFVFVIEMVF